MFSHNPPAIGHAAMCSCGHAAMVHLNLHKCRVSNCKCRAFTRPLNTLADRVSLGSLAVLLTLKKRMAPKIPVINIYGAFESDSMSKRITDTTWIQRKIGDV